MSKTLHLLELVAFLLLTGILLAEDTEQEHTGSAIQSDSLLLTATVLQGDLAVLVDDTTDAVLVMVTSSSKTLDVTIEDPSGNITPVGSTGLGVFGSQTYPETADTDPLILGKDYVFKLEAPEVGTWVVHITETVAPLLDLPVVLNAWMQSDVQAFIVGGEEDYPLGAEVALGIFVMDATAALNGYTITADVFRLADATFTPVSLTFADDGIAPDFAVDDLTTASLVMTEAGVYDVQATIEGTSPGGTAYRRDVHTQFRVIDPTATLVPATLMDQSIDVDLDGLFESVEVSNDVSVFTAGDFALRVTLVSAGGVAATRTNQMSLLTGVTTMPVSFDKAALLELGEDGPYSVSKIVLERLETDDELIQDTLHDVGMTAAYLLADLDRGPIVIGAFSELANDCDLDGDFDSLAIDVEIDVLTAAVYQYSMTLTDSDGRQIEFISGASFFSAGVNTLSFDFDAYLISARGGDGPYSLSSALIFSALDSLVAGTLGSTQAYTHDQFQAPPTTIPINEDFELLAPGAIDGQSGWAITAGSDPTSATVSPSAPFSGLQSLELRNDPAQAAGTSWGAFSPINATDDIEQVVDVSLQIEASGGPGFEVLVQSPTEVASVAWIRFAADGEVLVYQPWAGSFAFVATGFNWLTNIGPGNAFTLQVIANSQELLSNQVSVAIDGAVLFSGPSLGSTYVEQVVFLTDNVGPDAALFVDDLVVINRFMQVDCNGNGQPDACDIGAGSSLDCNANGIPDECDITAGVSVDCNGNGVPDECELTAGTAEDCNGNGIPDTCDIAAGLAPDCNLNGVIDDCELATGAVPDCNSNGFPDSCDIASGFSQDCNGNGIPDSCDFASGAALDCNGNGLPDSCDIASGFSADCNGNGVPDSCDLSSGFALDCNGNSVPDSCDLASGASQDCNSNGIPDECDIAAGASLDLNSNGLPDECEDFHRGDVNGTGDHDISDALGILDYLVGVVPAAGCLDAYDVNDDGQLNLVDPIFLLSYLFSMGAQPADPFLTCGADLTTSDPWQCGGSETSCP